MTEFLDELARSLARPMPRSRAVRLLGLTVLSTAVPWARPRAAAARRAHTCGPGEFDCHCPSINGLFFVNCCWTKEACNCVDGAGCCREPLIWGGSKCVCPKPCKAGCCGKDEQCCGNKCCRKDEFCAVPDVNLCCNNAERGCRQRSAEGSTVRAFCCPEKTRCCASRTVPGGADCCGPDQICDENTGFCRCSKTAKPCGQYACCEKGEKCCPDKQKCCGAKETCCDGKCCGAKQTCCNGVCCDKACCGGDCCGKEETCMTTRFLAGGSSTRSGTAIRRVCCPKPRILTPSFCCPPGTVAGRSRLTRTCCPPANPHCCGELGCAPGESCVSGTCGKR